MACSFLSNEPRRSALRPLAARESGVRITALSAAESCNYPCFSGLCEAFELRFRLVPFGLRRGDHSRQLGAPLERVGHRSALPAEGARIEQAAVERLLFGGEPRRRGFREPRPAAQRLQGEAAFGRVAPPGAARIAGRRRGG